MATKKGKKPGGGSSSSDAGKTSGTATGKTATAKRGGSKASQYIIQRKVSDSDNYTDLALKAKPKNSVESKKALAEAISSNEIVLSDGDEFRIISVKATGIKPKVATITKVEL